MIVFRVDGNEKIGLGHVMRCMSIAEAFLDAGEECFFILADVCAKEVVEKRGFGVFVMNTRFDCMDVELPEMCSVVTQLMPRCVVVDSYYVTQQYLGFLKALCRVIYLDDLASFAHPVDILINYNVYSVDMDYASLYRNSGEKLPQCILGSKYAPLRREFKGIQKCVIKKDVGDILISAGGADPMHLILGLVRFLKNRSECDCISKIRFHVILGALNVDKDEILELSLRMDNVVPHLAVQEMGNLIRGCDLAISAAGSTLYELCACGVPTVTYVIADNQIFGARAFEKAGVMISLGDIRGDMEGIADRMVGSIINLTRDFEKRKKMARRMRELVDGYGADRLVGSVLSGLKGLK